MNIIAARLYISPRTRALTAEEAETRRLSYAIKDRRSSTADFATAGLEMARLISGPCWLVTHPQPHWRHRCQRHPLHANRQFPPRGQGGQSHHPHQPD